MPRYADIVRNRVSKLCPHCGKLKSTKGNRIAFHMDAGRGDGLDVYCKLCRREIARISARKRRARIKKEKANAS